MQTDWAGQPGLYPIANTEHHCLRFANVARRPNSVHSHTDRHARLRPHTREWLVTFCLIYYYTFLAEYLSVASPVFFGDCGGLEVDQCHLELLKQLFSSESFGVYTLSAVCFVMKNGDGVIDAFQTYIYNTVSFEIETSLQIVADIVFVGKQFGG